jgi:hypothetical protein
MKKIALVLALILITGFLFAADPAPELAASLSGKASLSFTLDLDTMGTTMTNAAEAKLKVTLVGKDSNTKAGEGDIYGEIKIKDFEAKGENADINANGGSVDYAKIVGNNWYVKISGTDNKVDFQAMEMKGTLGLFTLNTNSVSNAITSTGGFVLGVTIPDITDITLGVFSMTDVGTLPVPTENENNAYGITAKVDLKAVENLTFKAGVNLGFGTLDPTALNDDMGFGAAVGYKISLGDDMTLEPTVAIDGVMLDDDTMDLAIGNGLRLGLGGGDTDSGLKKIWGDKVKDGLSVGWDVYLDGTDGVDPVIDIYTSFASDGTLVEGLVLGAGFEAHDLTAADPAVPMMALGLFGSYAIDNIVPYAGIKLDLTEDVENGLLIAGVSIKDLFPKVDLDIDYKSANIETTVDDTNKLGQLTVKATVNY